MKTIAMYLPQYHKVRENDEWWGEDFTDWVSVKSAIKLFEEHKQPRIPKDSYYYDLMEKSTMQWQERLMCKYGVYGLCFYHYWFRDGRKILEKPAENLLKWKDVNIPFCFSWANETWAKTWSNVSAYNARPCNVWMRKCRKNNGGKDGILLEQQYGGMEQWKRHFDYLLPFFKDERYIKIDGYPVFIIYQPDDIDVLEEMIRYWNELADMNGIGKIYLILTNPKEDKLNGASAVLYHEPKKTLESGVIEKEAPYGVAEYQYSHVWDEILDRQARCKQIFYGGFVGYDDTPRHGKSGSIVSEQSPFLFRNYLTELYAKNYCVGNEFVFINAWNEWGEGMYLEPDEEYGNQYLECFEYAEENYVQYIPKYRACMRKNSKSETIMALRRSTDILDKWLSAKDLNVDMGEYLFQRGIKSIAVYGYGMLGKRVVREVGFSNVIVKYAIDKKAELLNVNSDIPVITPDSEWGEVDVVIVTPVMEFRTICDYGSLKTKAEFLPLDELLWNMGLKQSVI